MKLVAETLFCLTITLHAQPAQTQPAQIPSAQIPSATPSDLNAGFTGRWVGQLEYRDAQSNEQVFLPTRLTIVETPATPATPSTWRFKDC